MHEIFIQIKKIIQSFSLELSSGLAVLLLGYLRKRLLGSSNGRRLVEMQETINKGDKMQKVVVQMEVPKESKEVVDFLAEIVIDLKMKKSLAEIASGSLPKLMIAVDGFSALGEEFASDGRDETAGYLVQQVMAALAVQAPAAPVA